MRKSHWSHRRLDEVVTLQRGHDLPTPRRQPGAIPVVGSFGITGWHDTPKAKGPGVAIGRSGASFGVATFVDTDYWPLNTALYVTDFHGNDELWVYWLLHELDFTGFNSGSAQPSLNRNFLADIAVEVPPLEEQRAIVNVLSAISELISGNRDLICNLREHAFAMFSRVQDEGGQERTFDQLAELVRERADPQTSMPFLGLEHFAEDGRGLVGEGELSRMTTPQQRFRAGDVLYGKLRPYFRKVARPGFDGACSAEIWVMRPAPGIPASFLNAVVASSRFTDHAMAGSEGTKMPRAKWDHIQRLPVVVPSREVLTAVASVAEEQWKAMTELEGEIRELERLQAELAPRLIRGVIHVDADRARRNG